MQDDDDDDEITTVTKTHRAFEELRVYVLIAFEIIQMSDGFSERGCRVLLIYHGEVF